MSIDADLRAGLLTADEAKAKRARLSMESMLHGGMDGAMKFVKGDAIAGLIITLVNILAGIVVGILYHSMTAGEAANRFAVLSIGDAMVSQIPALFICMAAGILTTRVADEHRKKPTSLGEDMTEQLTRNTRSMYLAGALTLGFAAIPGFPAVPFCLLAAGLVGGGQWLSRRRKSAAPGSAKTHSNPSPPCCAKAARARARPSSTARPSSPSRCPSACPIRSPACSMPSGSTRP